MNNSRQPHSESSSTSPKSSQNFPPVIPVSQSLTSRSTFNGSFTESVTSTNASGVEEKETITVVSTETNTFTTTNTSANPDSNIKYSNNEKEKIRFSIVRKSAGKSANVFKNTLFQSTPEDDESQKQSPNVAVIAETEEKLQKKEDVNLRPEKASKEVRDAISYNGTHRENSSRKRSRSRNSSQDIISQKKHPFSRESRSIAYESTPYRRYSPRIRSRSPHRYDSQWHYSPRGHSRSPQYYHRQRSRSPSPYRHYERRTGRSRSRSPTSRYQHYEPRRRRSRSRSGTPSQGYDNWRWRSAEHKRSYNGYDSYRRGYSKSRSRSPYSGYDSYRRRSPRSRSRSNSRPTGYHYQGSTNWSRGHNSRIQTSSGPYHKEPVSLSRKYENSDLMEERKAEHASNDRSIAPPPPPVASPGPPPPPLPEVENPTPTPPPPPLSELKIPTPPPPPLPEIKNPKPPPPPLLNSKVSKPTSPSLAKFDDPRSVLSVRTSSPNKLNIKKELDSKGQQDTVSSINDHQNFALAGVKSRSLDIYEKIDQVGEGTYGKVYKARNRHTGIIVALKRIRMESEKEGFPVTAMREIKLLQSMNHNHIIKIHEIAVNKGSVYMVLDYMDYDLTGFLAYPKLELNHAHIKCLMKQILEGIHYLHVKNVLHRDIKGSNILMNRKGEIKLADFGLARIHERNRLKDYTNRVITLWYRPPELLLGATKYGAEVDIWSVGCIMMELFLRKPIFQGSDEISQLEQIYRIMGVPSKADWPSVVDLPWFALVRPKDKSGRKFRESFKKAMTPAALDLAEWLLTMDPSKRPVAKEALNHPYFTTEEPEACPIEKLPSIDGDWHEYESKQRKKKQALDQASRDQANRNQSHTSSRPSKESHPV